MSDLDDDLTKLSTAARSMTSETFADLVRTWKPPFPLRGTWARCEVCDGAARVFAPGEHCSGCTGLGVLFVREKPAPIVDWATVAHAPLSREAFEEGVRRLVAPGEPEE